MLICDLLNEAKDRAINEKNAHIFTIATLTGHVMNTYGKNYSVRIQKGHDTILKHISLYFSVFINRQFCLMDRLRKRA